MADNKETYDYVIVGAGSAGCVLANRLSEHENTSVLLLEAGPEDTSPEIHIPGEKSGMPSLLTDIDWQYKVRVIHPTCREFG